MSTPLFTAIVIALSVTMFTHASTRHCIVEPFTVGFPYAIQANNVNRNTGSISNNAQFDENAARAAINPDQVTRQRQVTRGGAAPPSQESFTLFPFPQHPSRSGVQRREGFTPPSMQQQHVSDMSRLADITAPRQHQGVSASEGFALPSRRQVRDYVVKTDNTSRRLGDILKPRQARTVVENYGSSMGRSPYATMNSRGGAPVPASRRPSRPSYQKYPSNANPPRLTVPPSYDKTVNYRFAHPTHSFGPMRPKNVEQTFGVDPLNPMNLSYSGHKMASPPIPSTEGYTREGYEQDDQAREGQLTEYDDLMNQITNTNHTRCHTPAHQSGGQDPVHVNVTEYVYAPQKSRLQAYADYFRGDLDVTPVNSSPLVNLSDDDPMANIQFRPAANAQMLRQGVLNVIAGRNEASERGAKLQSAFTGGANSTYGGTTRDLSGREVPGDITVKSFV